MSLKGPSMRRHRDGRFFVKLNGTFITLGRVRDVSRKRYDKLMSKWLDNDH